MRAIDPVQTRPQHKGLPYSNRAHGKSIGKSAEKLVTMLFAFIWKHSKIWFSTQAGDMGYKLCSTKELWHHQTCHLDCWCYMDFLHVTGEELQQA